MTTVLLIVCIVYAAYCRIWLWRVSKHDRVLFPFCQLRRDVMKFLRDNVHKDSIAISKAECESALRLVDVLNGTIGNYKEHKVYMFNIRFVSQYLEKYQDTIEQMEPIDRTDNPEIRAFHERFGRLLVEAFFAYTPLIRWELAWRVVVFVWRAGERRVVEYVIEAATKVRDDARRYGVLADTAT